VTKGEPGEGSACSEGRQRARPGFGGESFGIDAAEAGHTAPET
jgi:hypothetical protein